MTTRPAEVADCIRSSELFGFLSADERAVTFLSECFRAVSFQSGSVILREGDEGDSMLMMLSGTVRIDTKTPAGEQYTVATLSEEQACFGELALFDSQLRSATAIADTDCQLLELDREAFERFANAFPEHAVVVYRRLGKIVSERLRQASKDIGILFQALVQEVKEASLGNRGGIAH